MSYPTRPARRPRPHAWWWLLAVGLLGVAALEFFLLGGRSAFFDHYSFAPDHVTTVPVDGKRHHVRRIGTEMGFVWTTGTVIGDVDCDVTDLSTGKTTGTQATLLTPDRYGGHHPAAKFPTGSGRVAIRCTPHPDDPDLAVLVGPDPEFADHTLHAAAVVIVAGGIGLVGVTGLVTLTVLCVTRDSRPRRRNLAGASGV